MEDNGLFTLDCFSIALDVAKLINKETGKRETIDEILEITKQILDISAKS